jgi:aminomethyltransferase
MSSSPDDSAPLKTPLHALHLALGARMAPFAGYDMPIQYPKGVLAEHLHCRAAAGLFDVSHMGQAVLSGPRAAARLETLVPGDLAALGEWRIRYTQFLNESGGILDDLMVTRLPPAANGDERLFLVVNAACKGQDFARLRAALPDLSLDVLEDRALLALQGPQAAAVLATLAPGFADMPFMSLREGRFGAAPLVVTRSGYTGEDGYEMSLPASEAETFARALLANPLVWPIGLGARDSLRLEGGLCLYGHDIDETTSPVEAAIVWSISKRRRAEGGFPGADRIQRELREGPTRLRVGLLPEGRAPAREGTIITDEAGAQIGVVTSGGFGPSLNGPLAMGYVAVTHAALDTPVRLVVRGKPLPARIVALPFVPNRFYRG